MTLSRLSKFKDPSVRGCRPMQARHRARGPLDWSVRGSESGREVSRAPARRAAGHRASGSVPSAAVCAVHKQRGGKEPGRHGGLELLGGHRSFPALAWNANGGGGSLFLLWVRGEFTAAQPPGAKISCAWIPPRAHHWLPGGPAPWLPGHSACCARHERPGPGLFEQTARSKPPFAGGGWSPLGGQLGEVACIHFVGFCP